MYPLQNFELAMQWS